MQFLLSKNSVAITEGDGQRITDPDCSSHTGSRVQRFFVTQQCSPVGQAAWDCCWRHAMAVRGGSCSGPAKPATDTRTRHDVQQARSEGNVTL